MTDVADKTTTPTLPGSAWILGWTFLAMQLLDVVDRGFTDSGPISVLLSAAVGAALLTWGSVGVLHGRTVRLVLAWIAVGLQPVVALWSAGESANALWLVALAVSLVQLVAMVNFSTSDYLRRQRTLTKAELQPLARGLLLLAVAVGVLAGLAAPAGDRVGNGFSVHLDLNGI
ncbi:hypothetical protein [Nocardioides houyundeii]|uniref:hypothetical protein n=1 Tax=Nocardioides houyundeii TaxID=2045452 RepID=UPI000C7764AF|nr:hypothetical protein [Nocardioides houyundeii]